MIPKANTRLALIVANIDMLYEYTTMIADFSFVTALAYYVLNSSMERIQSLFSVVVVDGTICSSFLLA